MKAWGGGDEAALSRLVEYVYPELRRIARRHMKDEAQGNSLQATALVHEVYLRLVDVTNVEWRARAQFFAVAAQMMRDRNIGAIVVVGADNRPVGILTDRDLAVGICANAEDSYYKRVKEVMRYGVITVSPDESVTRVMNLMTRHRVRHIPVVRDGELAGIVSIGDVVKHRLDDLEIEINVLRDAYIAAR